MEKTYPTNFYTPDDVMQILHIGRTQVYKLFKSKTFPSLKIGGQVCGTNLHIVRRDTNGRQSNKTL